MASSSSSSGRYDVHVQRAVLSALRDLPRDVARRVDAVLLHLEEAPRPPGAKKLAARQWWRLRIGDYRLLYTVDDDARIVAVYRLGHRRDVYR